MTQLTNHLEANLKREITKLYKSSFGKGPKETTVKIFDNIVFIRFDGGFSQIEQSLMGSEVGKEIVRKIRDELILEQSFLYVPVVEKIVNAKVDEVSYIIGKKNNAMYISLVFENDIEIE